jgi:hypothetical protein
MFLHASHNLWMQSIFFPLTSERAYTKWVENAIEDEWRLLTRTRHDRGRAH